MSTWLSLLKPRRNLSDSERVLSGVIGAAFLLGSLRERGPRGWFMAVFGSGLYLRGFTGNSQLYGFFGHRAAQEAPGIPKARGIRVERTFLVHRPVADVFRAWRNFENLPHFMTHLERVTVTGPNRSHWIARAPAGLHVAWDAEIVEERPNELIAWRSLSGADVDHAGRVAFRALDGDTELRILLAYNPPGGRPGAVLARFFHEEPGQQIDADLLRFKHMMEVAG